jgi:hypothetical protein
MPTPCGAKTRAGGKCKAPAMKNGKCRVHGGASTGAPKGNQSAAKHGIYGDLLRADESALADVVMAEAGRIESELMIARFQLRRALTAQGIADGLTDGMEVFETIQREGAENATARSEVKKKLRDYPQIIDKIMARIESLEKTRIELLKASGGDDAGTMAADDTVVLRPDEPIPDAPIV